MKADPTSLDQFHDLIPPPPEPWWPPAPGWTIVLIVIAVILSGFLLKFLIRWQANRYRREALRLLNHPDTTAAMMSSILKRAALTAWPRREIAGLTGNAWLGFLDRSADMDSFVIGPGSKLETAAFDPAAAINADALRPAARDWISKHRGKEGAR